MSGEFPTNAVSSLGRPGFLGNPKKKSTAVPVIGASAHLNATQSISSGAYVPVSWDALDFDVGGLHSGSPFTVYTVPSSGFYLASASLTFASNVTGLRGMAFFKNGSLAIQYGNTQYPGASNGILGLSLSFLFNLLAGDTVSVNALQTSGAGLNLMGTVAGLSNGTFFSLANIP